MIPHSRPLVGNKDIDAVTSVMSSGMIAGGNAVAAFERDLALYIGSGHAAALSSGTAALFAVLHAMHIGPGDTVVIPAYVCSSLMYAVRMTGAEPVVADSGDDIFHMDRDAINKTLRPSTKAIVFPHMFGAAKDISDIVALGVPVIEDCSLSLGSSRDNRKTGSLGSVAAVFSFYATKVIASGEGGMALSDDNALIDRIRDFAHYADHPDDRMRFNFAMSDITAALGCSQLSGLPSMIDRRRELASRYTAALSECPLKLPTEKNGEYHIYYRYVVKTNTLSRIREEMKSVGIVTERPVYQPLSRYASCAAKCPRAEKAWETALSIPLYPALTDDEADNITSAMLNIMTSLKQGDSEWNG